MRATDCSADRCGARPRDRVITDRCIDIRLPKLPDITKTFDDVPTAQKVDRVVSVMHDATARYASLWTNHHYQALVFMGAWLGPWNEAIGLRICDINPLRRELTFGRQVINQNDIHTFSEVGSKTGDWRTVPVPQPVMDARAARITRYRHDADREVLLFTNARGGQSSQGAERPSRELPPLTSRSPAVQGPPAAPHWRRPFSDVRGHSGRRTRLARERTGRTRFDRTFRHIASELFKDPRPPAGYAPFGIIDADVAEPRHSA